MKAPQLEVKDTQIRLVEPEIGRDSRLGVKWLNAVTGRSTMQSMGNSEAVIRKALPTTVKREKERIRQFIEQKDQLNWMIEYDGEVVGAVWVDLYASDDLPGPAVHIMIGNPEMRGQGIGRSTIGTVLEYLEAIGHSVVYSRRLTSNKQADKLLKSLRFTELGEPYASDTLEFQNLVRRG